MKISLESDVENKVAAPVLDRLLSRLVATLEKSTGLKFNVKADGQVVRLAHKALFLRKKATRVEYITYDATDSGYKVFALDHMMRIVDSQEGESGEMGAPDEPGLSLESNLQIARRIAEDWADELGVNPRYVAHDPDILSGHVAGVKTAGAQEFTRVSTGKSAQEAFNKAVSETQHERGHGGYTGSIAEKHSFVTIVPPQGVKPETYLHWIMGSRAPEWTEIKEVELKPGQKCPECGKGKVEFKEVTSDFGGKPYIRIVPTCNNCGRKGFQLYNTQRGDKYYYGKRVGVPEQYRAQIERDQARVEDKWGPAGAIQLGATKWVFFGWASS